MTTAIQAEWVALPGPDGIEARRDVTVLIENDRIVEVRDGAISADTTIKAPGSLLIPGLINGHTHIGVAPFGRGVVEDADYTGVPFYMKVSVVTYIAYAPEMREELKALMAMDMYGLLRSGVTSIVTQNTSDAESTLALMDNIGMRGWAGPILPSSPLARGTLDENGNWVRVAAAPEVIQAELDAAIALHGRRDQGKNGRVRVIAGPASAETCPDEFMLEMARLNAEWGVPMTLHLAQSEADVAQAHQMYGKTSAAHLADLGVVGPSLICAHGSLLSDDDVTLLSAAGATVAHCANRKAKEGVFSPFQSYLDRGLRVILGNDGFVTDFIDEIRMAAMLGKLAMGGAAKPTAATTLAAATEYAADALQRADLGRIAAGNKADLTLISLNSPFVQPVFNPITSLIYYASGGDVEATWIDGVQVVGDRKLLTMDGDKIQKDAAAAAQKIWGVARERGKIK